MWRAYEGKRECIYWILREKCWRLVDGNCLVASVCIVNPYHGKQGKKSGDPDTNNRYVEGYGIAGNWTFLYSKTPNRKPLTTPSEQKKRFQSPPSRGSRVDRRRAPASPVITHKHALTTAFDALVGEMLHYSFVGLKKRWHCFMGRVVGEPTCLVDCWAGEGVAGRLVGGRTDRSINGVSDHSNDDQLLVSATAPGIQLLS